MLLLTTIPTDKALLEEYMITDRLANRPRALPIAIARNIELVKEALAKCRTPNAHAVEAARGHLADVVDALHEVCMHPFPLYIDISERGRNAGEAIHLLDTLLFYSPYSHRKNVAVGLMTSLYSLGVCAQ